MPSATPAAPAPPGKKTKRRLRRFALIFLVGVLILLPLINGPICRKLVHSQLDRILYDLYLEGNFKVAGTILSGIEVSEIDLKGSRNLQSLTIAQAKVKCRISPLIKGNWGEAATSVYLRDTEILFDTSENFPTNPDIEARKAKRQDKKREKEKPSTLWKNLDALCLQDIEIANINLNVKSSEKQIFGMERFTLKLLDGTGSISTGQIIYPNGEKSQGIEARLDSSGENIIEITALTLTAQLDIQRLTVSKPPADSVMPRPPLLSGEFTLLGGHIVAEQSNQNSSYAKLDRGQIDLAALEEWLDNDLGITGSITRLDVRFQREAPYPIHIDLATEGLSYRQYSTDRSEASIEYRSDEAKVTALSLNVDENSLQLSGSYLPATKKLAALVDVSAPNIQQLAKRFELPDIGGSLNGEIDLKLIGTKFTGTKAQFDGSDLSYGTYALATTKLNTSATESGALAFDLSSSVDPENTNTIELKGEFDPETKTLRADPQIEIADLAKFTRPAPDAPLLRGSLTASGTIRVADGKLTNTDLEINASDLTYKAAMLASLRTEVKTTAPNQLDFGVNTSIDRANTNTISSNGTINLDTLRYESKAVINLPKLAELHPALASFEVAERPTGKFHLNWTGAGGIKEKEHRGTANITDFSVRLDDNAPIDGKLDLQYSPDSYHLTNLQLRSDKLNVTGAGHFADKRISVESLRLFNGEQSIARADISIPFDQQKVSDLATFLDQPGEVSILVESDKLKLAELIAMTGKAVTVEALIDTKIDIAGTLTDPTGNGDLNILQLRSLGSTDLAPADITLDFKLGKRQLTLDGKLQHPEIQPITIKGNTPLRIDELSGFSDQAINLALNLPETNLAILTKYVPNLSTADGKVSAKVNISGTTSSPQFAGDMILKSPLLKWNQQKIPTLSDIDVSVHLEGKRLRIERFNGYLAGGEINLGGNVDFDTLKDPKLDLSLLCKQALLFRNDSVSLRANADLKLAGPYYKAALAGKIGITQSRYFREIEILPIGLPRSSPTPAAPRAPSFGTKKEIGVAATPFKDWSVDVKLVTDDAFLVRSNLAKADIVADIAISGSLGKPVPRGQIRLEEGKATLPFSELETKQGTLTFSEKTGFDPEIDVQAVSKVQDYNIQLIAYGQSSTPKTLITSDPPLPESEAIALIATGSKSSDLNNGDVIAGNAALLLIDKLRRKYGKGTPVERTPNSLREKLDFKAGQIDPRTGNRSASASLELTDRVYLLGNLDVEGEYRGLVQFLFRIK